MDELRSALRNAKGRKPPGVQPGLRDLESSEEEAREFRDARRPLVLFIDEIQNIPPDRSHPTAQTLQDMHHGIHGIPAIAAALLRAGADPAAKDRKGRTALRIALEESESGRLIAAASHAPRARKPFEQGGER